MAIVNCRVCNKRISSRAESCSHCGALFSDEGEITNLETTQMIQKMRKRSRIQTLSFLAIIVFLIGALLWLFRVDITFYLNQQFGLGYTSDNQIMEVAKYTLALGFVGYIAARIMIYINKKK
ncbi:hypothetical protein [Kangiella sp. HZ709]|uniref:hypothetical protein n=1 Tax=Kangiella sp. HZ709 TaxID=2666328 RepID=UPI0012AEFEC5|nr:hypothetical protein [Kangiella sp. HZ709]MRX26742.1 hypothetical protein [Kangiella sp. HZ709]